MKIDLRVQEIWSGHESVTDRLTDEGHSYNPFFAWGWVIGLTTKVFLISTSLACVRHVEKLHCTQLKVDVVLFFPY